MTPHLRTLVAILALAAISLSAHADSDGYFCVGPTYLAYELSFSGNAPLGHQLHIVQLGDGEQWNTPVVVDLPEFQTQAMNCTDFGVTILAWNALYDVKWRGRRGRPSVTARAIQPGTPDATGMFQRTESLVLGPSRRTPLKSSGIEYSFVLVTEMSSLADLPCEMHVRSVIQRIRGESVIDEHILYSGTKGAECGE